MLTKEKYELLSRWADWYAKGAVRGERSVDLTCFFCALGGSFVESLPDNHELFKLPTVTAMPRLSEMLDKHGLDIKAMLGQS